MQIGILGSTRGTNLLAITDAIAKGQLSAQISIVISNKNDSLILERARARQLLTRFLNPIGLSRAAFDEQISNALQQHSVDLVVLLGYMRILSSQFVSAWQNKIINVHPSLLPAFSSKMDIAVHRAVLQSGEKETGCTVHYVTDEVDAGPIILQKKCPVLLNDTPESLKKRVQALEGLALIEVINKLSMSL
jgi:phosphoribosylglycinamide formyltransferase-1